MAKADPAPLYEPCTQCGGMHPVAASDLPPSFVARLNVAIRNLIGQVWRGEAETTDPRTLALVGKAIQDSMEVGFGKTMMEVDWTTPDGEMLTRITRDVWQFSAAKNYHQLRDMTLALTDDSGKLRTLAEFEDVALKINDQYNRTWLKTEYNQAVGSATMAARWNDYKKNADIMPYLQYSTVGDDNVRDEHRLLDGIIRKIGDNFWATHYPPNGWGCRCDVTQLAASSAVETGDNLIPKIPINPMFRTNLADTGLIFPKGHPYYNDIPKDVLQRAVASLPDNVAYQTVYKSEATGKTVELHIMHGIAETPKNIEAAKVLADRGHDVKLLPILDDDKLRQLVYKTDLFKAGKNPDALVDGNLWEFKVMDADITSHKNIQKNIHEARKQADRTFITTKTPAPKATVDNAARGMKPTGERPVWIYNNGVLSKY